MTTPLSGVEVVGYRPELKDKIAALWGDSFAGEPPEKREYLEWKYERNPYLADPILVVALDGSGEVIGTRGFCGTRWRTPEAAIDIPCAEDFALAPELRNTGLATVLMRFALEDLEQRGYEYVLNATGAQITVLHSLAMGWRSVGAMEPVARRTRRSSRHDRVLARLRRYWRPGSLSRGLYRNVSQIRRSSGHSFDQLDRIGRRPGAEPGTSIAVESSPRDTAMMELADRLPADGRIRHVRDRAFFEWRFGNPSREYRFLYHERDGRLEGYLALARTRGSQPATLHLNVVDWEGTSHAVRAELLECALSWGAFEAIGAWTASLPGESRTLLADSGFRPADADLRARGMPCVLLRKLGDDSDWSLGGVSAVDPSHWDIRLIDSMHG